jgi:hypothetical protein
MRAKTTRIWRMIILVMALGVGLFLFGCGDDEEEDSEEAYDEPILMPSFNCMDYDGDGYKGRGCDFPEDCDDNDANNWISCATCIDGDSDNWFINCDTYTSLNGPDCDDSIANAWNDCSDCADNDGDGWGAGISCDLAPDCDDGHPDTYPGAPELCDGIDNQCPGDDGYGDINEGCPFFARTFGGATFDYGSSLIETSDGGLAITGVTKSFGAGGYDLWLIKTDADGNKIWDRTFGGWKYDLGFSLIQTLDGGLAITGYTGSYAAGFSDLWLIKTDSSGNKLWDKTFSGADYGCGFSLIQTSDGELAITGKTGGL